VTRRRPEQLDIPLVWETEGRRAAVSDESPAVPRPRRPGSGACGIGRMLLAALTDLGLVLIVCAVAGALALTLGAGLSGLQLVLIALIGLELSSLLAVGCLWGWGATPGMMLLELAFSRRLELARAGLAWLVWVAALPSAGLLAAAGRRGFRVVERAAGSPLACHR
jgi:hypothetical protein